MENYESTHPQSKERFLSGVPCVSLMPAERVTSLFYQGDRPGKPRPLSEIKVDVRTRQELSCAVAFASHFFDHPEVKALQTWLESEKIVSTIRISAGAELLEFFTRLRGLDSSFFQIELWHDRPLHKVDRGLSALLAEANPKFHLFFFDTKNIFEGSIEAQTSGALSQFYWSCRSRFSDAYWIAIWGVQKFRRQGVSMKNRILRGKLLSKIGVKLRAVAQIIKINR